MSLDVQAALTAPMLDHASLDLEGAHRVTYRVEQVFRYTYDTPVTALSQRLVIVPRARHGHVFRRAHQVRVDGARAWRLTRDDEAGNTVVRVTAAWVEHSVEFDLVAVLEYVRSARPPSLPASMLDDPWLRQPTRLTAADDRLRGMAADLRRQRGGALDLAERICATVYAALPYEFGVTSVTTTAAQALAAGRGVCQDAAHTMIALCHLVGLPVRYVSGHVLGQGGTHAWVEVIVPDGHRAIAVAYDPSRGRPTHRGHISVAVGRDYDDVAPTSGTYVGAPGGQLTSHRSVGVVGLSPAG